VGQGVCVLGLWLAAATIYEKLTLSVIANTATVCGAVSDSDFRRTANQGMEKRKQYRTNKQKKLT